ncbi:hypothetical protein [Acinetobacter chinensis]|uniref:hypothetical protein n=1 Tax=Acinetobacter chinensis TaxID=2004650 RepID=UPI0029340EA6|nr:hypothetical protein [Acinetobacter chinensis]WOE40707.1 hypothetical protein QSG87_12540 [Acinetobacter chinensis]
MGTITQTITTTQLVVGDGVRTENAKVKTATAYKHGDLLKVSTGNLADHPAVTEGVVGDWNVIAVSDFTAEQSTYHANNNLEMPVYVQGAFDIEVVTVNGTSLTAAQYDAVRAQALTNKIELRKVVGS